MADHDTIVGNMANDTTQQADSLPVAGRAPHDQLGPLPEPHEPPVFGYTSADMRAYARREVDAERERIGAQLLRMHERDGVRHNYWLCAWRELFGA